MPMHVTKNYIIENYVQIRIQRYSFCWHALTFCQLNLQSNSMGGLINHDRCSTSVEGGAARESHLSPRSWRGSKAVISQNPTTPSNKWPGKINGQATITSLRLFCISSLCIYFLRFISHTRSLATTPRASSFGGFPSFSHKTSHSGE